MAIPSGYTRVEYIQSSGAQYIDSGYSIGSTTRIVVKMGFTSSPSTNVFLFGTSYYTGTASSRQNFGLAHRTTATGYAVYNGGQWSAFQSKGTLDTSVHTFELNRSTNKFYVDDTEYSLTANSISNIAATMLIFASRQSGSSSLTADYFSSARLYSFKIYNGDTLIRDFVPVLRDNDSVYCLYDQVNDVSYTNAGSGSFTGGSPVYEIIANASPSNGGTVTGSGYYASGTSVTLTATAQGRYSFSNWSDGDTNSSRTITVTEDAIYTAIFTKPKVTIGKEYWLYGKKRYLFQSSGDPSYVHPLEQAPTFQTKVMSADINEDLLQKATSTIVCADEVPLAESDLIFIRDGKNNQIYTGFIQEVNGNTIVVSQAQSFFDFAIYAMADTTNDKANYPSYTYFEMMKRYLTEIRAGWASTRTASGGGNLDGRDFEQGTMNAGIEVEYIEPDDLPAYPYRTENEVINGEELLYQMYSQYEVIPYLWLNPLARPDERPVIREGWSYFYLFQADSMLNGTERIPPYRTISMSNNAEFISEIDVQTTTADDNVLIIYDSSGTTFRGSYAIRQNGTYTNALNVIGVSDRYIPPKRKYVNSDDELTEVRNAELKRIQHNHKVSFTFDLNNNFYNFGDLALGQNINFYVGDRLYNSVLTGWSFHIEDNQMLNSIRMVCGKVRNNLTSKLNMGKVK